MNRRWTSRSATAACCTRTCRSRSRTASCRCIISRRRSSRHTVASSEVIGFEALARWRHPVRGFVPPGDFIPLAEESGLIVEMGEWILRQACREAASWPMPLQVAVNLSPAQFMHGDVVGLVHSILLETGLAPDRLELEITEGVLIEDFDRGLALLRRLKALGVRIAMDDFGSGYSSLSYLQAFPFDKIKIDRAFVMNLGRNPQSAGDRARGDRPRPRLEMSIVAEGVETQEQLGFLADEGCDAVQGYFIGKPAPIGQYVALVGRCRGDASRRARRLTLALISTQAMNKSENAIALRMADYDLAIIGGGLNGVSVARDAAGRGLRVILLEQGDLGGAASSATGRLIQGDLSVLERRALFRVRARRWPSATSGCGSRRIWCARAVRDSRPFRRASAVAAAVGAVALRPAGAGPRLPASATVDITHHPIGNALKRPFGTAFEYSDCVVDDSRLVIASRGCRRAGRRDPHRRALRSRRPARYLAACGDRSRASPGDHGKGAGQRQRRLDRVGRGDRAANAAAGSQAPDRPDRRQASVRDR